MSESTAPTSNDIIPIESLDQFVAVLTAWHTSKVETIKHLLTLPEGSVFMIGEEELVLTKEALAGFKFGIGMALMQIEELPFVAEVEDTPVPAEG